MIEEDNAEKSLPETRNPQLDNDSTLEALINQEQTLPHRQLKEKLGRDPTQEEVDEWLNAHTESY